jgi:hypothetical protein
MIKTQTASTPGMDAHSTFLAMTASGLAQGPIRTIDAAPTPRRGTWLDKMVDFLLGPEVGHDRLVGCVAAGLGSRVGSGEAL